MNAGAHMGPLRASYCSRDTRSTGRDTCYEKAYWELAYSPYPVNLPVRSPAEASRVPFTRKYVCGARVLSGFSRSAAQV